MSELCQGMMGMLLPRPCDRKAAHRCTACKGHFCGEHMDASGPTCRACGLKEAWPKAAHQAPVERLGFTAADLAAFELPPASASKSPWVDLT